MYYQEKVIDGLLHFKTTPDGEWKPITAEQLTHQLLHERKKYDKLLNKLCVIQDAFNSNPLIKAIQDSF